MHTISPLDKVLVTGGNGYIGLWVVRVLLERGYRVRVAVRSDAKGSALKQLFPEQAQHIEHVLVPDITADGAYDDAVRGVAAVVHIASPITLAITHPDEIVRPAVKGTTGLLESALKHGTQLKRIVVTSSILAVQGAGPGTYTEADWADYAVREIEEKGADADKMHMYAASKVLAERAAWKFYADHKASVSWDITVLNVAWSYGPTVDDPPSPAALPSTIGLFFQQVFTVRDEAHAFLGPHIYVDIRDVADAHARALEIEQAGGERIAVASQSCTWQDWLNSAAEQNLLPKLDKWDAARANVPAIACSNAKAERILGICFRTIPETLRNMLDDFRARGWLAEYE